MIVEGFQAIADAASRLAGAELELREPATVCLSFATAEDARAFVEAARRVQSSAHGSTPVPVPPPLPLIPLL
jgi:hypothetical protein